MTYVEEKEFNLRIVVRVEFPDDYDGDDDGYAWAETELPAVAGQAVAAVAAALGTRPGWKLRGGNRGRPSDEEVTLVLEKTV